MAETLISPLGNILRDSKILVSVDHASEDILVVSFPYRTKLFQGILIDSTNRYLPCGYPSQEVVRWSPPRPETLADATPSPAQDTNRPFYSLSNRFTYFQDVLFQKNIALAKCAKQAKAKAQKMTVRLRPRQVLCSKCRSICNENSENVHSATNNKKSDGNANIKNLLTENSSNENQSLESKPPRNLRTTLVPKLSRLEPEDMRGLNGGRGEGRVWSEMLEADKQMVLRKKRSVGSMEDLWDETVFEEAAKKAKTTPIIKISFGSPGEGTVLKIPSKVQLSGSDGEEESKDTPDTKALKKALKKAKKEAKRKISPEREQEPLSPSEPNYKKHRHRVKHKKRHKNSKEEEMKDKCLKQKLSINLKRVCGGPGEEESWSGESSRSSEPVKEPEETKPTEYSLKEPFHQLLPVSQLGDRLDCKENLHKGGSVPVELSMTQKAHRTSSLKKKNSRKLQTLESLLKIKEAACAQESLSERLSNAVLKEKQSDIDKSSKCNILSIPTNVGVSDTENTFSYRDITENVSVHDDASVEDCIETMEVTSEVIQLYENIRPSSSDAGTLRDSHSFHSTKDISQRVETELEPSSDFEYHSDTVMTISNFSGNIVSKEFEEPNISEKYVHNSSTMTVDSEEINPPVELDDTLDLLQGSEDSLLEMEDHAEDELLESDKETLEISEHPTNLFDLQMVSQLEVPKKSIREVDNCDIDLEQRSDETEFMNQPLDEEELLTQEPHSFNDDALKIEENVEEEVLHCSEFEPSELPQSSDDFQSISTKVECSEGHCTISDEPLDSSEDSEFLPAEDGLDCIPPEDGLFCVPIRTLDSLDSEPPTLDRASSNLSLGCTSSKESLDCTPPPLDPAPSESLLDCPSPQDSLDAAPPINSLDCAPPHLDCQDCVHPLENSSRYLPPDLDYPPPSLDCASSLESVDQTPPILSDLFENSEECAPPLERLDCAPSRGSLDCAPPNLDFGPSESPRSGSPLPESMESAPSLESFDGAPIDDPTGSFSPEIALDSIPEFPASSPIGTPQDVSSFRTEDGSVLSVGDIVWAKLHGFPWWPAKVERLCASGSTIGCDARVTWFGSATSSLTSADQLSPFIQTFKSKYNRERKSNGYREAIRQATTEATSKDIHHPQPIAEINKLLAQ